MSNTSKEALGRIGFTRHHEGLMHHLTSSIQYKIYMHLFGILGGGFILAVFVLFIWNGMNFTWNLNVFHLKFVNFLYSGILAPVIGGTGSLSRIMDESVPLLNQSHPDGAAPRRCRTPTVPHRVAIGLSSCQQNTCFNNASLRLP